MSLKGHPTPLRSNHETTSRSGQSCPEKRQQSQTTTFQSGFSKQLGAWAFASQNDTEALGCHVMTGSPRSSFARAAVGKPLWKVAMCRLNKHQASSSLSEKPGVALAGGHPWALNPPPITPACQSSEPREQAWLKQMAHPQFS